MMPLLLDDTSTPRKAVLQTGVRGTEGPPGAVATGHPAAVRELVPLGAEAAPVARPALQRGDATEPQISVHLRATR